VLALGLGRLYPTPGLLNVTPLSLVEFRATAVVTLGVGVPEEDVVGKEDGAGCRRLGSA